MNHCATAFLLVGLVQAVHLKNVAMQHEDDELTIKMPDAIAPEEAEHKIRSFKVAHGAPETSGSLVQAETSSQLGMLESGVLHSSMKPIVKAKVKKVLNFIQNNKDTYETGTPEQKKELQQKAESLIMQGSGTRSFNLDLCNDLWNDISQWSGDLSFYYCPQLIFPDKSMSGTPPLNLAQTQSPSRLRSAFLTEYWWDAMLHGHQNQVIAMLDNDVCYYAGAGGGTCGIQDVSKIVPHLGFPTGSKVSRPVQWHCDTNSCIAPVKAWADHAQFCLTTWGSNGKLTEIIVPLNLWR